MPARRKDTLYLGPEIEIPVDAVTARWGILGTSGSGKSNVEAVLAEELWRVAVPWVVIDPKGDWWGLRYAIDGQGPGLPIPIFGGLHGDIPLEPTAGAVVADMLVDQNISAILDISRFSEGQKREFLVAFCHRLFDRHQADPHVRHVIFEEAHRYIPQSVTATTAEMKEAAAKIALEGRVFGLGCSAASQRSSRIHKDVLTQWDILIGLRAGAKLDREAVGGWFEEHPEVSREILPTLDTLANGEGWLLSPQLLRRRDRVRFYRRATFDSGQAPKVGQRKLSPRGIADVNLSELKEAMAATIERAEAKDPEKLARRIRELERELKQARADAPTPEPERVMVALVEPATMTQLDTARSALSAAVGQLGSAVDAFSAGIDRAVAVLDRPPERPRARDVSRPTATPPRTRNVPRSPTPPNGAAPRPRDQSRSTATDDHELDSSERRVLDAVAWWRSAGYDAPSKQQVGFMAGYRVGKRVGGRYGNILGALRSGGLISYPRQGEVTLTEAGARIASPLATEMTTEAVQGAVLARLDASERRVMQVLIDAYPDAMTKQEVGTAAGYEVGDRVGGRFGNILGALRTLGVIEYPTPGQAVATDLLFLE